MMYVGADAAQRKALIHRAATFALATANYAWPDDLWSVAHVRFSCYVFNVRAGTDAGNEIKLAVDACQGIFYLNDSVVSIGECPKPEKDGTKTPRVEYVFDLLEERSPIEARKFEIDTLATRMQRLLSTAHHDPSPAKRAIAAGEHKEVKAAFDACRAKIAALITSHTPE